jgi:predicted TIM-barrel fold metal-dependent hydrolase
MILKKGRIFIKISICSIQAVEKKNTKINITHFYDTQERAFGYQKQIKPSIFPVNTYLENGVFR